MEKTPLTQLVRVNHDIVESFAVFRLKFLDQFDGIMRNASLAQLFRIILIFKNSLLMCLQEKSFNSFSKVNNEALEGQFVISQLSRCMIERLFTNTFKIKRFYTDTTLSIK